MVVEAVDSVLGIIYRRKSLPSGHVEVLHKFGSDMAQGILSEQVTNDAVVLDEHSVRAREHSFSGSLLGQQTYWGREIDIANIHRRRFLIFDRKIRYRK